MEINCKKNLLPIGSVVTIRFNNDVKLMITGYSPVDSKNNKIYDYMAVIYPFGFDSYGNTIVFDRDVIKKVHFIGYKTDDYQSIEEYARDSINNYKNKSKQD